MLLAKTLTSSTFKIALIAIGTFGVIVSAIFSYVYLSTASYVRGRSDRTIMTEQAVLQDAYRRSGRDGLIALVQQRIADTSFAGHVYLLTDPSLAILAGNLKSWPSVDGTGGWTEFRAPGPLPDGANPPLLRAMLETLPGGDRLLVGRDIGDLDSFTERIKTAVISGVALDLRAGRSGQHPGDAPDRGPDRIDQRDHAGDHAERPRPAHSAPRQP